MASMDNLSDSEIRLKLTELGYPVGPITSTTRKVLLKKLKYLTEQAKVPGSGKKDVKNHSSLSRYSSEEESEDETSITRSRRSMPPPPPPKSPPKTVKRRSFTRHVQDDYDDSNNLESVPNVTDFNYPSASTLITGTRPSSDPNNIFSGFQNHRPSSKNIINSSPKPNTEPKFSSYTSRFSVITSKDRRDSVSDTDGLDDFEDRRSASKSPIHSLIPGSGSGASARSRFHAQQVPSSEGLRFSTKASDLNSDNNLANSPFSSDFVRKLTASSPFKSGAGSGLHSRLLDVKESDDEDVSSAPSYSYQNTGSYRRELAKHDGNIWKSTSAISMVLLVIVCIFFCTLAILYLNKRYKETEISSTDANLPICTLGEKPGATCILSTEVKPVMNMFREIYQVLNERAVQYECNGGLESSALTENQLTQLLVDKLQVSVWEIEKYFGNIKVLIRANPQWGVEIKENGFNIPSPNLPLGCYVTSFLFGIVGSALRLVGAALVLTGLGWVIWWWVEQKERNKKEVFKMVESIIDILSTHQQNSVGENFVPISHVRDQLIPPHKREEKANIWNKAVAYLEENESRVRTEVQQVLGEEFSVWRWLSAPRSNGKRKVWQGQAFETIEGSVNSLPVSPTPCLKIRHMFDSDVEVGEDWMTRVQDAILEKCEGVQVLHVAVDKNSNEGCVYVKCASSTDAGRAYRALHGSWFDSKLVTVKYLRLERYHERFPDAVQALRPLRPSNDRKLSLQ